MAHALLGMTIGAYDTKQEKGEQKTRQDKRHNKETVNRLEAFDMA
jgi:hypothetical protein